VWKRVESVLESGDERSARIKLVRVQIKSGDNVDPSRPKPNARRFIGMEIPILHMENVLRVLKEPEKNTSWADVPYERDESQEDPFDYV
jgi:hypothetical protein